MSGLWQKPFPVVLQCCDISTCYMPKLVPAVSCPLQANFILSKHDIRDHGYNEAILQSHVNPIVGPQSVSACIGLEYSDLLVAACYRADTAGLRSSRLVK